MIRNRFNYKLQKEGIETSKFILLDDNVQISELKSMDLRRFIVETENYALNLRENLGLPSHITFGLEIEFEQAIRSLVEAKLQKIVSISGQNPWNFKTDITVSSNENGQRCGGEITSPIANDNPDFWLELDKVCKMLRDFNAKTENKAGGHIHFGSQILGTELDSWIKFIKLWTVYEKIIYRFSFGDKLGSRTEMLDYAHPVSNLIFSFLPELKKYDNSLKSLIANIPIESKQALRFENVRSGEFEKYNTLEVRCPNSTLNSIVWQNNVNMFSKMLIHCKSDQFDIDFIDYKLRNYLPEDNNAVLYNEIYLQEALEFCDLIFSNNLDKAYFLKQYLKGFENIIEPRDNVKNIKL